MQLFREILKRITYEIDSNEKFVTQRAAASSISLPTVNEQSTRQQMASLMQRLLKASDAESVRRQLQTAICNIKALYTETHDGFSQTKGIRRQDRIKVADMAAFSVAPGYGFEASTFQLFNFSTLSVPAPDISFYGVRSHFYALLFGQAGIFSLLGIN